MAVVFKKALVLVREAANQGTVSQGLFLTLGCFFGTAICSPEVSSSGLMGPVMLAGVRAYAEGTVLDCYK